MSPAVAPTDSVLITAKTPQAGQPIRLARLTATFDQAHHGLYADLLDRVITDGQCRNIALTGAYGVGKSSILNQIANHYPDRVVPVSLSTLNPDSDLIVPPQNPAEATRSNQIQKEIVKQLLYRLAPDRTPRSRYHRVSTPSNSSVAIFAVTITGIVSALAIVTLVVTGTVFRLMDEFAQHGWGLNVSILLAAFVTAAVFGTAWYLRRTFPGSLSLSGKVEAGLATVSLAERSSSYFDQYLDEIVYFFQVSKRNIVLIEDIDRFNDVLVFDTLRALNRLLNNSDQIEHPILFIYAIRDSVLDLIGANTNEATPSDTPGSELQTSVLSPAGPTPDRADRTKFFDVIIPVVPFISADNARDLMTRELRSTPTVEIDQALVRLAARHFADMRLLRNIRNEFEVYRDRLLLTGTPFPGNTADHVFALILVKNYAPADFEAIRLKDSSLDDLYTQWRHLVQANLATHTEHLSQLQDRRTLDDTAVARAKHAGHELQNLRQLLLDSVRDPSGYYTPDATLSLDAAALELPQTWADIADGTPVTIRLTTPQRQTVDLTFDASRIEQLVHTPMSPTQWEQQDRDSLDAEKARTEEQIEFLKHHTWREIYDRREFTLAGETFSDLAARLLSPVAHDLVRAGYLTSHFALYAATYYGEHLSPNASEYLTRHIERGDPDFTFSLTRSEVVEILKEQGADTTADADLFRDPGMYNVAIVDYLFDSFPKAAAVLAQRLCMRGPTEQRFVDTYLTQGTHPDRLVAAMTPTWPDALHYLVAKFADSTTPRTNLIDAALTSMTPACPQNLTMEIRSYLQSHYAQLAAVTAPQSPDQAEAVLGLIAKAGAIITELGPLNDTARASAENRDLYPITRDNLRLLAGDKIALDELRSHRPRIYQYAIRSLPQYLDALTRGPVIRDPEQFPLILRDIATASSDPANVARMISATPRTFRIASLADVPESTWTQLAATGRLLPTLANVKLYRQFDANLGTLLANRKSLPSVPDDSAEDRLQVAVKILAAARWVPDPGRRVALAKSLKPGTIPATDIEPERSDLIARLLKAGLVADAPETFSPQLFPTWEALEAAIAASTAFASFTSPTVLPLRHVPSLLRSSLVSIEVRNAVGKQTSSYMTSAPAGSAESVAAALADTNWRLTYTTLEALRAAGAGHATLIRLLSIRDHQDTDTPQLKQLLQAMGGPYGLIATGGGRERPNFPDDQPHATILGQLRGDTINEVHPREFTGSGRRLVATLKR